ncbi:MAG: YbjQ family protein [Phycisphaerae bacterium]
MSLLWLQFLPILIFLCVGIFAGGFNERRHYRRLARREAEVEHIFVNDCRSVPHGHMHSMGLVTGEVVIASDYFKTFVTTLRKLIGGELRAFESLMERARREALLRMKDQALQMGANAVINVRFESSNIGMMRKNRPAAMVEMYAYGTAVRVDADSDQPVAMTTNGA